MFQRKLTRREFIQMASLSAAGVVLAGYTQTAPQPQAAATATPAPKLGDQLIGKLEGPEIIRDVAKYPKKFSEAPAFAELVKAGKLPPIEKRLPEAGEVMVVKPLKEVGKYGGTWRRAFTGPADTENGNRLNSTDKILFWDYSGTKITPSLAKDWKVSDDGKVITILLRKGLRWSDGEPFTADAFVFWYEEIYMDKELVPTPVSEMMVNNKPGVIKKVDDYTVAFEFPEPNFLFVEILAGSTAIGGGQASQMSRTFMGGYAPRHYLKQFLPKYSSLDEVEKKAKAAGFDSWKSMLRNRVSWALNPELPVVTPWKTISPINTPTWTLERNPYYWAVDAEGNQLPYFDKVVFTLAENLEVVNLRAIAGEYDVQERHIDLGKLPVYLENAKKGNYIVRLDPAFNGSDVTLHVDNAYEADAEIAKWLTNVQFRHAISMGIDRDQLNETFWLGVGTPGSTAPAESTLYSPGPEYRKKWCTLDVKQSNEILDKIGLDKKDAEGYRLRTDGKGRLRIEVMTVGGQFVPYTQIAEMIKQQWKKIGIDADIKETERSLAFTKTSNNEHQIMAWANDGSEMLFLFPRHALPVDTLECHMGMAFAKYYVSNGAQGKKPTDPEMLKAFDLFRAAAGQKDAQRIQTAKDIWKIIVEQQWSIGTVGQSPAFMGVRIVKNNVGNVPERQVNAQHARTPCSSHPITFYFKS